jgi:O-antigen/teichoic acid export membrane protein
MQAGLLVVGGNLVGAAAAFAAAIVAARSLSIDGFAAFGVGLAVNSLAVQFADFGLGTIAIAETADAAHPALARAKLRTLALHRARTALLVGLLLLVVVLLLPSLAPYRATAVVAATGEVFGCFAFFFIWSLQGERRFAAAGMLQSLQGALRLALVGACAIAGFGSVAMMAGYAVLAPLLAALAGGALLFGRAPADLPGALPPPTAAGAEQIDLSRRRTMALTAVFAAMVINGDVLLLTALSGTADVAAYTAAWRFASGVLLINTAIASALLPFIVTAPDAWAEARHLVRRGAAVAAGWLLLTPPMVVIGPLLLGSVGEDAGGPLALLLVAFAIDGFYFVLYQIYLRVRRERLLLGIAVVELATMALVTVLLRDHGALAPAYGQLAARVVVCAVVAVPIALAALGRCSWFATAGASDRSPARTAVPAPRR